MARVVWFAPGKVTLPLLKKVFERAWYEITCCDERKLKVRADYGLSVSVFIDESSKVIWYRAALRLVDGVSHTAAMALADRLNNVVSMMSFTFVDQPDSPPYLLMRYDLSFAGGISAPHLVRPLRAMNAVLLWGIERCDEEELVG